MRCMCGDPLCPTCGPEQGFADPLDELAATAAAARRIVEQNTDRVRSHYGDGLLDLRYPTEDERRFWTACALLVEACAEFPGVPADEALAEWGRARGLGEEPDETADDTSMTWPSTLVWTGMDLGRRESRAVFVEIHDDGTLTITANPEIPPGTVEQMAEQWRRSPAQQKLVREITDGTKSIGEGLTEAYKAGLERAREGA